MDLKHLKRHELAAIFRVAVKTITRWAADGLPRDAAGRYDLSDCIAWRIEQADKAGRGAAPDEAQNSQWLEKYRRERALLARLERKSRQGELMPKEKHDAIMVEACSDLRNTMLSWPSRVFPTDDTNRQKLREEVFRLLENFIKYKAFVTEPRSERSKQDE